MRWKTDLNLSFKSFWRCYLYT